MRIRCVTFNLQGLGNDWFEVRAKAAAAGLRKFRPDIVCLQESTIHHGITLHDQAKDLADAVGLTAVAFNPYGNPIEVMSLEQGGIAVISRWPIVYARNRRLPIGHDHPPDARVGQVITVMTPQGPLTVINVHLSWLPEEAPLRVVQLGMILNELPSDGWSSPASPIILMGDFNATEQEPVIELANQKLKDAFRSFRSDDPGFTWVRTNPLNREWKNMPDRRIDYIFCPKDLKVRRAEVLLNDVNGPCASDHFAVMAELEWSPVLKRHATGRR